MHAEKLPSGLWRATVKHGGQRRRTPAKPTKREATAAAAQLLLDMMADGDEPARRRPAL